MSYKLRKTIAVSASLILMISILSGCSQEDNDKSVDINVQSITTKDVQANLENKDWVIVDTRINDAYNGWALDNVKRGGHIPSAVDFSANWLDVDKKGKEEILQDALEVKGIDKDKNIVLYDSNKKDSKKVASYLQDMGYENLYTYDINEWANDESLPMEKYESYEMIVPAYIINEIIQGNTPETFVDAKNIKIVEASWGDESKSYSKGHVPTSIHINTDSIEPEPDWMLASDEQLAKFANDYGFTKDDTIIVTGEDVMASYRVAVVLRYIGVSDVRVLNGGNDAWVSAGYKLETKSNPKQVGNDFGESIPTNKELIDTTSEVKESLNDPNFTLVDTRSWDEHIGKKSGYTYYFKKGRVPGAIYGYAGSSSTTLEDYRNIDNTMRNGDEVLNLWKTQNIDTNNHLSFMCGSGWRAAEVLTYANVLGLDNTSLYSDGWMGWSSDESNPIEKGEPK